MTVEWLEPDWMAADEGRAASVSLPMGFIDDIGSADSLTNTLNALASWLPSIIEADRASVTLATGNGELELFAIKGNQAIPVGMKIPMADSMVGEVFVKRKTKIAHDLHAVPGVDCQMLRDAGLGTCLDAPLVSGDQTFGTLNLAKNQKHFYSLEQAGILATLAKWVASHIRIHRQIQDISALAMTDPLTEVMNRRAFFEAGQKQLERWHTETEADFALAILDLDHFKNINDQFGHGGGDAALVEFARQLKALVRRNDLVARIGGEEFAIILRNMAKESAASWAEGLIQAIHQLKVPFADDTIRFTTSIGVATPTSDDTAIEMLLQRADAALYESKAAGRDRVTVS